MDYLHWIGKSYYTTNSFIKEAEKFGVTRRISLRDAKRMAWGDTVYCAMLDGKTGVIFGYFKVDLITGLDEETAQKIKEEHRTEMTDPGNYAINRGCGEYVAGPTHSISASLEEIYHSIDWVERKRDGCTIESAKPRPKTNKLMIGGTFTEIEKIRLLDIPFRQGFREINGIALRYEAKQNNNKVHGQFYLEKATKLWYEHNKPPTQGKIQSITKYTKNPNTRKKGHSKAKMPKQLSIFDKIEKT